MNFAKLFQVDTDTQVVVLLKINENEKKGDQFKVIQMTEFESVTVDHAMSYNKEDMAQNDFDSYKMVDAKEFVTHVKNLLSEGEGDSQE